MKPERISFKEYQNKVLDLYEEVYKFLESISVKWWVHSGALIGIKRHNNELIPWDDDIDIMVTSKQWEDNLDNVQKWTDKMNYTLIDFKYIHTNVRTHIKFAKIISDKSYIVYDGDVESDGESRPFIDVFFACPSKEYSVKGWNKYTTYSKIAWIADKGFDRFTMNRRSPFKTFLANFFSYPLKLVFTKKRFNKYLDKPFKSNGNWEIVKRADCWSNRNFEYDLINGMEEGTLGGKKAIYAKDWDKELSMSYGSDWRVEKPKAAHIMGKPRLEQTIFVKEYLRNKYK